MLYIYYLATYSFTQFITLPLWWYSRGLYLVMQRLFEREKRELVLVSVHTWIRHYFVPMFHDYTIVGRLLSVFFRTVIIVGKTLRIIIGLIMRVLVLLVWLLTPFMFIWGVVYFLINTAQ